MFVFIGMLLFSLASFIIYGKAKKLSNCALRALLWQLWKIRCLLFIICLGRVPTIDLFFFCNYSLLIAIINWKALLL